MVKIKKNLIQSSNSTTTFRNKNGDQILDRRDTILQMAEEIFENQV